MTYFSMACANYALTTKSCHTKMDSRVLTLRLGAAAYFVAVLGEMILIQNPSCSPAHFAELIGFKLSIAGQVLLSL